MTMGRHLIEWGYQPGREMGIILKYAFEAQLDGVILNLDDAALWTRNRGWERCRVYESENE